MKNQTHFQGTPVAVAGKFVTAGTKAPDFCLTKGDLGSFKPADAKGKKLLLNIFPSIDTPVCSTSVRKFNELASGMSNTLVLCISRDLPFAQSRFCGAEGLKNVITLSDFRPGSTFGQDYGVLLTNGPLSGLFARAVVVIDGSGNIVYADLVDEITSEPDYERALQAVAKH